MPREETRVGDLLTRDVDAARVAAGWERVRARRARPRIVRRAITIAPVAAIAVVLALLVRAWLAPPTTPTSTAAAATAKVALAPIALAGGDALPAEWSADKGSSPVVPLDDGSRLELAPGTRVRTGRGAPDRVELAVDRGRTTFDVKPGGPRAWVVDAGPVVVRVLGTRFTVARDGDDVSVTVERGKVQVESRGVVRVLTAGEKFESTTTSKATETPAEPPSRAESAASATQARTAPLAPTSHGPPLSVAPTIVDPMDRADAQRRAGQSRDAVTTLRGVVDGGDRRASLAAFTLAKIHAEDLGDALSAAKWFDRAIALGLPAGLDEEAHARAVESYARAGARAEASRARTRYEARFPGGRHLSRVKEWAARDD